MQYTVEFANGGWARYQLVECKTARQWASIMQKMTVKDRCTHNTIMGQAPKQQIEQKCQRLQQLAQQLQAHNSRVWLPTNDLTADTVLEWLSPMHQHFPEMHHDPQFSSLLPILDEYNDTIHWLETAIRSPQGVDLKLDFKGLHPAVPIAREDLDRFTTGWPAGAITLHYAQVGRHTAELYWNRDMTSPKEQWVPQTVHTASCYLRFRSRTAIDPTAWAQYWQQRGGLNFWGLEPTDPQLRLGYIQLGHIVAQQQLDPLSNIIKWTIEL